MPIFVLILLLTAFPALSTDMYLPAIPLLCDLWGLPLAQVNLSLAAFFISFSAFLLVHGPLADRFGRRPVLVGGVAIYVAASLLCAGAAGNVMLILARVLQALGASAAAAMSLTLAKDLYQGDARKKLLAYIGVIVPLCPMVAPTIGALLLKSFSWRGIFVAQAVLALPALYGCLRLREPRAPDADEAQAGSVLARYARLLRNRGFMAYAVSFAVLNMAFFSFIGGSAAIYIRDFGLSEDLFGLFFAANALAMMGGALLCSRLCVGIESGRILAVSLMGCLAGGALMFFLGGATPLRFAVPMAVYTFFTGMSRPISNHVILEQVDRDTGTAASLVTFFIFLVGGVAMEVISLPWPSKPLAVGAMAMGGSVLPLVVVYFIRPRA